MALLAFGSLKSKSQYADQAHVMEGEYSDFEYVNCSLVLCVIFSLSFSC